MTEKKALKEADVLNGLELDYEDNEIRKLVKVIYDDMWVNLTRLSMDIKYTNDASLIKRKIIELKNNMKG